jgi:hypothetical protein
MMNRSSNMTLLLATLLCVFLSPFAGYSGTLPPYPLMTTRVQPSAREADKAEALFLLAHKENRRLVWDACLSRKAFKRAKAMVEQGYFAHQDPKTGRNPAWAMVTQCNRYRHASENLMQGYDAARICHRALMQSPTHRANVLSPEHQFLGVGCFDHICVELFAGF